MSTLDANLNVLLGTSSPTKIMRRYFRDYRKRSWRRLRSGGAVNNAISFIGDARLTADFASQSLRQGAMRVQGVQRKVDAVVQAVTNVIRLVVYLAIIVLAYDQLYDHHYLPAWASFEGLDHVAKSINPYPPQWTIAFILVGLFLTRQAGKVKRRYKEPTLTLPDRRQVD